jgi:vacuolar-type H+-ATPase subunit E/Vma4
MSKVEHVIQAPARVESLLAQQEVIQAALKTEKREYREHVKQLVKTDPVCEEKRAVIESYKEKLKAIKETISKPDNGQMILNLAGPDFAPLG